MAPVLSESDRLSDTEILRRFEARDERAISDTQRRYGARLYALALRLLGDKQDSEECVSDVYAALWNAIPPAKPQNFFAFACALTRRIAVSRWRERTRARRVPSELTVSLDELFESETEDTEASREADAQELADLLNDWLRRLPASDRHIFISRWYEARPVPEIASGLSLTPSAVYKTLTRLKESLRVHLERNGITL